ncbi:MAG: hypothetical protein J6K43_02755 [Lachnospiraceae bacterium]|nr:hypothetical protein [Lachnospiraceae bacterium]
MSFELMYREKSFLIGSGTGKHGGGRVWLKGEQIGIFGRILANGEDSDYYGAGGSGGTIILQAFNMTIDRNFFPLSYSLVNI